MSTWEAFKDWLAEPYKDEMSALGWFYFIGLLIIISFAWRFILMHMRGISNA